MVNSFQDLVQVILQRLSSDWIVNMYMFYAIIAYDKEKLNTFVFLSLPEVVFTSSTSWPFVILVFSKLLPIGSLKIWRL